MPVEFANPKSRFLADAEADLAAAGYRVLRGKALGDGRGTLKLLHDVARQVFGIGGEVLSGSSLMARVIDRLAPLVGEDPGTAALFATFLREAAPSETSGRHAGVPVVPRPVRAGPGAAGRPAARRPAVGGRGDVRPSWSSS